jgi:hypothetical protein
MKESPAIRVEEAATSRKQPMLACLAHIFMWISDAAAAPRKNPAVNLCLASLSSPHMAKWRTSHPPNPKKNILNIFEYGDGATPWYLVTPKIAGKWMFIPLKMYL